MPAGVHSRRTQTAEVRRSRGGSHAHVGSRAPLVPTILRLGAAGMVTAGTMVGVVLAQNTVGLSASDAAGGVVSPVPYATVAPAVAAAGSTVPAGRTARRTASSDPAYRSGVWGSNATGPARVTTVDLPVAGCPVPTEPGQFPNGKIPRAYLCALPGTDGQRLRSDAAAAWVHLDVAYRAHFGTAICLTDSYRSLKVQKKLFKRKPLLAAVPGTSNHGLGIAVDLCGGIDHADSLTHQWMQVTAGRFGWTNPPWAQPDGGKPEPWHWEYAAPVSTTDS